MQEKSLKLPFLLPHLPPVLAFALHRLMTQSDIGLSLVILACCMHAGTRVVRLCKGENAWDFEVLARFEEHRSMNYGADFQPGGTGAGRRIVSISFYDKLMCLWKFQEEID